MKAPIPQDRGKPLLANAAWVWSARLIEGPPSLSLGRKALTCRILDFMLPFVESVHVCVGRSYRQREFLLTPRVHVLFWYIHWP